MWFVRIPSANGAIQIHRVRQRQRRGIKSAWGIAPGMWIVKIPERQRRDSNPPGSHRQRRGIKSAWGIAPGMGIVKSPSANGAIQIHRV
jgi:hypothetical protein